MKKQHLALISTLFSVALQSQPVTVRISSFARCLYTKIITLPTNEEKAKVTCQVVNKIFPTANCVVREGVPSVTRDSERPVRAVLIHSVFSEFGAVEAQRLCNAVDDTYSCLVGKEGKADTSVQHVCPSIIQQD
ncbi:MAG: hypothetical protein Q8Q25_02320 [bacterium]|nr:hypothetical protein [bacterium]